MDEEEKKVKYYLKGKKHLLDKTEYSTKRFSLNPKQKYSDDKKKLEIALAKLEAERKKREASKARGRQLREDIQLGIERRAAEVNALGQKAWSPFGQTESYFTGLLGTDQRKKKQKPRIDSQRVPYSRYPQRRVSYPRESFPVEEFAEFPPQMERAELPLPTNERVNLPSPKRSAPIRNTEGIPQTKSNVALIRKLAKTSSKDERAKILKKLLAAPRPKRIPFPAEDRGLIDIENQSPVSGNIAGVASSLYPGFSLAREQAIAAAQARRQQALMMDPWARAAQAEWDREKEIWAWDEDFASNLKFQGENQDRAMHPVDFDQNMIDTLETTTMNVFSPLRNWTPPAEKILLDHMLNLEANIKPLTLGPSEEVLRSKINSDLGMPMPPPMERPIMDHISFLGRHIDDFVENRPIQREITLQPILMQQNSPPPAFNRPLPVETKVIGNQKLLSGRLK